jgi:nitroreductase
MSKSVDTNLPVLQPIKDRWSPRAFDPKQIPEIELQAMLEALRWSSSCFNEQPWQILITHRGDERHQVLLDCVSEGNCTWAQQAPVLMLAVARLLFTQNEKFNRHAGYDLGQAIAQLAIQATSRQIHLHQMGGFSVEAAKEAFGLNQNQEPYSVIAVGYLGDPDTLTETQREKELGSRLRRPLYEMLL